MGRTREGFLSENSWDAEQRKWDYDKRRAAQLKKLLPRHLTPEEKDLVRMFTGPTKHESIFEYASFALHWFCRNHGCVGYYEAMGIPEYAIPKKPWLEDENWQPPPVPGEKAEVKVAPNAAY